MLTITPERESLFWEKVQKSSSCWAWTGAKKPTGYGRFGIGNREVAQAHQVAYVLTYGQIPDGLEVHHTCFNRSCVRPSHLEAVTHQENVRRTRDLGCYQGHPWADETIGWSKDGRKRWCRKCHRDKRPGTVSGDAVRHCAQCDRTFTSGWITRHVRATGHELEEVS